MSKSTGVFKSEYKIAFVLVFLALLSLVPVHAQVPTGTILGTVKDTSGGAVVGATVTAVDTETGASRSVPTGQDGGYRLDALPVGHYSVKVTNAGFKTFAQNDIVLEVSQQAVINATLQVGTAAQEVVVTGEAPKSTPPAASSADW